MSFDQAVYIVGLSAGLAFAITGALAAAKKDLDVVGFLLIGTVTGIGGGTVRDLILDTPVFWVGDSLYLWGCIVGSLLTYFFLSFFSSKHRALLWIDAVGMALFCVVGAAKAASLGMAPVVSLVMGVITATFGSILCDTILNQHPVLLEPEIYVTACALGPAVYLLLQRLGVDNTSSMIVAMSLAFLLRAAAIVWNWRLPK